MSIVSLILQDFERQFAAIDHAVAQVSEGQFTSVPAGEGNPITSLVAHLSGALLSRVDGFLVLDQEKPWRDRHSEFHALAPKSAILPRWEEAKTLVHRELSAFTDADLGKQVLFRGQKLPAGDTLLRLLTHVAYHAGQVVLLARLHLGPAWKPATAPTPAPATSR
jgi:hypothetical protein